MEDSALRDDLVALVEESIGLLDPAAQAACELHYICAGLQSLGCIREQRAKLAATPIKVAAYTGPQHLSTQKADVPQLSALVSASLSLGYRHIVFSYAVPAKQPTARPSASAFEHLMGTGLPDRETIAEEAELSFDKALYNWLVDMCAAEGLGVRRDEKEECAKLLKDRRDERRHQAV